jgi:putative membrane protein
MWGCGVNSFLPWGGFLSLLIWIVIILALVLVVVKIFKSLNGDSVSRSDRNDSLDILKVRFAKGEITQEEYVKMKKILEG